MPMTVNGPAQPPAPKRKVRLLAHRHSDLGFQSVSLSTIRPRGSKVEIWQLDGMAPILHEKNQATCKYHRI
jgi:hypothetical protein